MDTKSYELYEIVNVRMKGKNRIKIKIKSQENQQRIKGTKKLLKKNRNKRKNWRKKSRKRWNEETQYKNMKMGIVGRRNINSRYSTWNVGREGGEVTYLKSDGPYSKLSKHGNLSQPEFKIVH